MMSIRRGITAEGDVFVTLVDQETGASECVLCHHKWYLGRNFNANDGRAFLCRDRNRHTPSMDRNTHEGGDQ